MSVLFAELSGPVGMGQRLDPEDLREVVSAALAGLIAEVEGLGGTITSVSGGGLAALFGAPEAHEDDPERAVRAGARVLAAIAGRSQVPEAENLSVRIGIETGTAIVGPIRTGAGVDYAAIGEVVPVAAALQSAARARSVLVGPATRAVTEGIFEWGPTEEVTPADSAKPVVGSYLERPKARSVGYHGQSRLVGHARLVGRQDEVAVLDKALRDAVSGAGSPAGPGSVVFIVGDPGLGKTRAHAGMPQTLHGLGGRRHGPAPALARGALRLLCLFDTVRPLPTTVVLLGRSGPRGGRGSCTPRSGESDEGRFRRPSRPRRLACPRDGAAGRAKRRTSCSAEPRGPAAGDLRRRLGGGGAVDRDAARQSLHWRTCTGPTRHRSNSRRSLPRWPEKARCWCWRRGAMTPTRGCPTWKLPSRPRAVARCTGSSFFPYPNKQNVNSLAPLSGRTSRTAWSKRFAPRVDGNPLFLEERVSSLLETGALVREENEWRVGETIG